MSNAPLNHELRSRLAGIVSGAEDQQAFAEVFSEHRERLRKMLSHRIDSRLLIRTDLSDILQEVYIDALNRIRHYLEKPELSFFVWLRQIALQRMIEVHRQHLLAEKRSLRSEVPVSQVNFNLTASHTWAIQLISNQASPSHAAMHEEMVARVEQTLESMDALDREVLVLRHFEELRNSEVAESLGISVAAASNRYVRALKRLRAVIMSDSDD